MDDDALITLVREAMGTLPFSARRDQTAVSREDRMLRRLQKKDNQKSNVMPDLAIHFPDPTDIERRISTLEQIESHVGDLEDFETFKVLKKLIDVLKGSAPRLLQYLNAVAFPATPAPDLSTVEEDVKEDKCPICHASLTSMSIWNSPCCRQHFHSQCIRTWLDGADTCPLCRKTVSFRLF